MVFVMKYRGDSIIVFVDKKGELFLCLVESNKPSKAVQSDCLEEAFKRFRLICCFFNDFKVID